MSPPHIRSRHPRMRQKSRNYWAEACRPSLATNDQHRSFANFLWTICGLMKIIFGARLVASLFHPPDRLALVGSVAVRSSSGEPTHARAASFRACEHSPKQGRARAPSCDLGVHT